MSQHENHLVNCRPRALLEQAVLVWNSRLYKFFPLLAELREFRVAQRVAILHDPQGHERITAGCRLMFPLQDSLALDGERLWCDVLGSVNEFWDAEDLRKRL
jgi:hypothetical protein